jgi:3-hydroxyisobutyrate dehydrogenase
MARVGFLGFGEVASVLSRPMVEHGAQVYAYDLLLGREGGREALERRAAPGIRFQPLPEVLRGVDYVLSTVTTQAAVAVARDCAPYLRRGQVYLDLNSTAPRVKLEIAAIVEPPGAHCVEGAILGAVGVAGAATRILLAGERAGPAADALAGLGLNVAHYSRQVGQASLFKMLRSIFSKGLEALLLELLIAARRAGLEGDLWEEAVATVSSHPFDETAANWIRTHAVACERRYHEMVQVAETMREIGVEPVMTAATEAFFRRSLTLGLGEAFAAGPPSMGAVIEYVEERLREPGQ